MIRDDLSDTLIHLTRGSTYEEAAQTFTKILDEKRLVGGSGCIKSGFRCVCFSEAPLSKLSQILANPMSHGMRYKPFGVMVDKSWLFERGGRPVIYQPDSEFKLLHEDQKFRHVRYDPPSNVDFTWEREWRIQTEELSLELGTTTVVVPNREWERKVLDPHDQKIWRRALGGVGMPMSVITSPWHFIALEDLGVSIPEE
jgi:hypothetical protein